MASDALFVGTPDHEAPVNTGVFLLKPRRFLYREGLRLLHNGSWTAKTGFNNAGAPAALSADEKQLVRLAAGAGSMNYVERKLRATMFVKGNTWFFVGGNIDQGELPAFKPIWPNARKASCLQGFVLYRTLLVHSLRQVWCRYVGR